MCCIFFYHLLQTHIVPTDYLRMMEISKERKRKKRETELCIVFLLRKAHISCVSNFLKYMYVYVRRHTCNCTQQIAKFLKSKVKLCAPRMFPYAFLSMQFFCCMSSSSLLPIIRRVQQKMPQKPSWCHGVSPFFSLFVVVNLFCVHVPLKRKTINVYGVLNSSSFYTVVGTMILELSPKNIC